MPQARSGRWVFFGQRRGRLSLGVSALRLESENAPLPNCAGFTGDRSLASFVSVDLTPATRKISRRDFFFILSRARPLLARIRARDAFAISSSVRSNIT